MTTPGAARLNWSRVLVAGLLWALVYAIVAGLAMLLFFAREFMAELAWLGRPVDLGRHLGAFDMASMRFVAVDLPTELVAIIAATLAGARVYRE